MVHVEGQSFKNHRSTHEVILWSTKSWQTVSKLPMVGLGVCNVPDFEQRDQSVLDALGAGYQLIIH